MIDRPQAAVERQQPAWTGLRVDTLITMRWITVGWQTVAVIATVYGFGFEVPLLACAMVIGAAAVLNIALTSSRRSIGPLLDEGPAVALLAFDTAQLAVLLWLTGGLVNPFVFMCLAPVTVSASSLSLRATLSLGVFALGCLTFVAALHLPLPWRPGEAVHPPPVYVGGMWVALVCSLGFLAYYARRVSEEAKRMQDALTATELVLARETQLSALDGLAAAAAHELGTPLSTITLVVRELNRELGHEPAIAEDLALLQSQANRCRAILATLSVAGGDALLARMHLSEALEEVAAASRVLGITVEVDAAPEIGGSAAVEPIILRNPGLLYSIATLLDNAVDFAVSTVVVTGRWNSDEVKVAITDDGPGFSSDVLLRLGEPFVSERGQHDGSQPDGSMHAGRGLGFFIAKTLIERSGGRITIKNRSPTGAGAVVNISWPRSAIDFSGQSSIAAQ